MLNPKPQTLNPKPQTRYDSEGFPIAGDGESSASIQEKGDGAERRGGVKERSENEGGGKGKEGIGGKGGGGGYNLPAGWEMRLDDKGRTYFIDWATRTRWV